jgi:AmpD protein
MRFHAESGLLAGARQVLSPHCDERPAGAQAELVVVHGISLPPDVYGGPHIERLFCGNLDPAMHPYFAEVAGLRVSAHLLVRRDGAVLQFVPVGLRAWHAGVSSWQGREACNDFSVGIELEGSDTVPYEAAQYEALAELVRALCQVWPALLPGHVVGHSDIAPGRKSDPGPAFDWPRLRELLAG